MHKQRFRLVSCALLSFSYGMLQVSQAMTCFSSDTPCFRLVSDLPLDIRPPIVVAILVNLRYT